MAGKKAIGIDLGTTFSCAAFYRPDKGPQIISNEYGKRVIPSVVYYDPSTGDALVGENAVKAIPDCLSNGLYDAKRILGRKFNDEYIARMAKNTGTSFSIVNGQDDQAVFQIKVGGRDVIKTPEEVSAEVLKYIKKISTEFLGEEVTDAVISVPAYFSNAQRKFTRKAAYLAGLNVLKLITEPTAAAIHYVSDKEKTSSKILVFDFGGGTLDVSIIEIDHKHFTVKAVYGDTFLGGRDIDELIFQHICAKHPVTSTMNDRRRKIYYRRLRKACIELKETLSSMDKAKHSILSLYGGDDDDLRLELSRDQLEGLTKDLLERAIDIVALALQDSGVSKDDIAEVVLVGGSTKIPCIRKMLRSYFGASKVRTDIHPDEAVAGGASVQAALLKSGLTELEKYRVTEITPLSLGIAVNDNLMCTIIKKHASLPCKISKNFITLENGQTAIDIRIFEGERKNVEYNNFMGEFTIRGLPMKRAGDVKVDVTFELDNDGILNVMAVEKSRNISDSLSVTMSELRLSERKIARSIMEARKNKDTDDIFESFVNFKVKVDQICKHIIYDLNKIESSNDRQKVASGCRNVLAFIKSLDFTEIERLEARFAVLKTLIEDILKENNMLEITFP